MSDRDTAPAPASTVITIDRTAYFAVVMAFVTALVLAGTSLIYLGWTLVLPILLAVWIARLRTVVDADGIHTRSALSTRDIAWDQVAGLEFPKWRGTRAVLTDKSTARLPAVTFAHLPQISAASGGRIVNPYTA